MRRPLYRTNEEIDGSYDVNASSGMTEKFSGAVHDVSANSMSSPPPCGEGLGVGSISR